MFIKESNKAQCMHDTAFTDIGTTSPFVEYKMKEKEKHGIQCLALATAQLDFHHSMKQRY